MEEMTNLEKLLSEDNSDNIILYDEDDKPIEFLQIALIPQGDELYAILAPAAPMEGIADNEAIVFHINMEDEELEVVTDEALGAAIFAEYEALLEEEN